MNPTNFTLSLAVLSALIASVSGHAAMFVPEARNYLNPNGERYNKHSGGTYVVHRSESINMHSLCGGHVSSDGAGGFGGADDFTTPGPIVGTYKAGDIIEVQAAVTAHHLGFFTVSLCDDTDITEECFASNYLKKANCTTDDKECKMIWKAPVYHEVLAPGFPTWFPVYTQLRNSNYGRTLFHTEWQLPSDITCTNCVLRMHYHTSVGCTGSSGTSEEFYNCADIKITDANGNAKQSSGKSPAPYKEVNFYNNPSIDNQWDLKCVTNNELEGDLAYFKDNHCVTVANVVTTIKGTDFVPEDFPADINRMYLQQTGTSPHAPGYNTANCGGEYKSPSYLVMDDGSSPGEDPSSEDPSSEDPTDGENPTSTYWVTKTSVSTSVVTETAYVDENGKPTTGPSGTRGLAGKKTSLNSVSYNHVSGSDAATHNTHSEPSNTASATGAAAGTGKSKLNVGVIAGAAGGGVLALVAAGTAGFVIYKKKNASNELNVNSATWLNDDSTGTSSYESKL